MTSRHQTFGKGQSVVAISAIAGDVAAAAKASRLWLPLQLCYILA
eukprot:CAMPEP_0172697980 /NCGR_PEP_ID=MMETSP1074-20121228/29126_1 /TAXON_ID=2916 /ORGANISM="Ceratium fusus, Strain PA161109" /LENGTH=44 /DNA_ID= /DNA_START= /DNA_END= /DNA_ORIENTATION=